MPARKTSFEGNESPRLTSFKARSISLLRASARGSPVAGEDIHPPILSQNLEREVHQYDGVCVSVCLSGGCFSLPSETGLEMGDGVADNWGQGTARSSCVCLALGKKVIKCGDKVNHPAMCIVSQPFGFLSELAGAHKRCAGIRCIIDPCYIGY